MSKQQVITQINTIASAVGLSGFYSSLPKDFKSDVEVLTALKNRRKLL